jgi:hypothetical protein
VAGYENRRGPEQNAPGWTPQVAPATGEPEYFGEGYQAGGQGYGAGQGQGYGPGRGQGQGYGPGQEYGQAQGSGQGQAQGQPYGQGQPQAVPYDNAPGHTRAFTLGEPAPLADPYPYDGAPGVPGAPADNVATYRAGQASAPPAGPKLPWKQLLSGIVLRPGRTFWQMRDHTMWAPALTVTFLYGLLAVFGFDSARRDALDATLSASIPMVLTTAVVVTLGGITLGAVTTTLARQLGGDGAWAPTIGLSLLVTSLTDAPRLLFALFLGGANGFVQLLGWLTWLACAALMTSMVAKSHDLPWLRALGAASIQLAALLMLFKLPLL